jgi:hypothetical protein
MTSPHEFPYDTRLNVLFEPLTVVSVDAVAESVRHPPREGFVVPKGVRHRTRAPERCIILMVETAGIVPTGS